jgi:cytochrome c55X
MQHKFFTSIFYILLLTIVHSNVLAGVLSPRQQELVYMVRQDCGSCHGMTLKGGLGPSLLAERLAKLPDVYLVETIKRGRPGTAMPPWLPILTETEIKWIVKWLKRGGRQ